MICNIPRLRMHLGRFSKCGFCWLARLQARASRVESGGLESEVHVLERALSELLEAAVLPPLLPALSHPLTHSRILSALAGRGMKIILIGAPGSGKGTFAVMMQKRYGIPAISTGDLVRDEIKRGTDIGKKVKALAAAGALISDDVIIGLVNKRLTAADCKNGFILDGYPRSMVQAVALDLSTHVSRPLLGSPCLPGPARPAPSLTQHARISLGCALPPIFPPSPSPGACRSTWWWRSS